QLGIRNGAGRIAMVHGMAALAGRVGGLNDDIAAEIGDLAAVVTLGDMVELQRLVEDDLRAVDLADEALLGLRAVAGAVAEGLLDLVLPRRGGEEDAIAGLPAADGLGQRDFGIADLRRRTELDPGAAQGGAVQVEAPTATDDGGAGLLVH